MDGITLWEYRTDYEYLDLRNKDSAGSFRNLGTVGWEMVNCMPVEVIYGDDGRFARVLVVSMFKRPKDSGMPWNPEDKRSTGDTT